MKSCFYLFTHSSPLFTFRNGNRGERLIGGLQISQNRRVKSGEECPNTLHHSECR
uniref:hypothetical protein n=1 Tax=Prevotella sp. TaxID=59823 RepID=UPI003564CDA2